MPIPVGERSLPLVQAIKQVTGRHVHLSTALRWCQSRNRYSNRLESWLVGGRRVTSVEAIRRYIEANTQAADRLHYDTQPGPYRDQEQAAAKAVAELDRELS